MKFYVIAGEASGDLHGSNLMKALKKEAPDSHFRFWGGDKMSSIAGQPVKHIKELAFMGFIEVVANLRTILKNIQLCKKDILEFQPDAIILIDYPGFNLRIAEFAKENKIPVLYYISPQVWAWKQNRVHKIRRIVDRMYCILPFEKEFYERFGIEVEYVGHPLLDAVQQFKLHALTRQEFLSKNQLNNQKILALLPGSRRQEIKIKLPIMLAASSKFPEYQVLVAGAPNIPAEFYHQLAGQNTIHVIENGTYDLLNQSDLAMVTSGTATLETALFKVPEVVCYKGSNVSYQIAKRLIKVNYISLVNLIMEKEVVTELIQHELTPVNIEKALKKYSDPNSKDALKLQHDYAELASRLGGGGASERTAQKMLEFLKQG